jgi:hypothetical protein
MSVLRKSSSFYFVKIDEDRMAQNWLSPLSQRSRLLCSLAGSRPEAVQANEHFCRQGLNRRASMVLAGKER